MGYSSIKSKFWAHFFIIFFDNSIKILLYHDFRLFCMPYQVGRAEESKYRLSNMYFNVLKIFRIIIMGYSSIKGKF